MKVSVVIATYRRKDSLREAIFSVLSQTWESIEIIVVDDNADEGWNTAVQEVVYSFSDIIYLKCEENKGSAEARNIGIRAALGEYITFLDDDDVYLPEKITHQMAVMVSEKADYCITDIALYGEGGDRLIEKRVRRYIKSTEPRELLRYHFMYHMTGTDTMMFRKEYILSFGGFARGNVGDEFYLMERAILAGGRFCHPPFVIVLRLQTRVCVLSIRKTEDWSVPERQGYVPRRGNILALWTVMTISEETCMKKCCVPRWKAARISFIAHWFLYMRTEGKKRSKA